MKGPHRSTSVRAFVLALLALTVGGCLSVRPAGQPERPRTLQAVNDALLARRATVHFVGRRPPLVAFVHMGPVVTSLRDPKAESYDDIEDVSTSSIERVEIRRRTWLPWRYAAPTVVYEGPVSEYLDARPPATAPE